MNRRVCKKCGKGFLKALSTQDAWNAEGKVERYFQCESCGQKSYTTEVERENYRAYGVVGMTTVWSDELLMKFGRMMKQIVNGAPVTLASSDEKLDLNEAVKLLTNFGVEAIYRAQEVRHEEARRIRAAAALDDGSA